MTWWHYLLLSNLYLILFFGFYTLLLRRETFFQLNRAYLVGSALLSFGIPLVQSEWVKQWFITEQVRQTIYQANPQFVYTFRPAQEQHITMGQIMLAIYLTGIVILSVKLLWQLLALKRFIKSGQGMAAWSFFKKINVNEQLQQHEVIMAHEQVHARQWHSADVLLIEAIMIVNWFNPVVYLYRNAIKHIHEFIADRDALKAGASKAEYAMLLLTQTFNAPVHGLLNPFFNQSILKQRIIMLQKSKSNYAALVKYGFSAPLFALMLALSSATINNSKMVKVIHKKAEQVFLMNAQSAISPALDTVESSTGEQAKATLAVTSGEQAQSTQLAQKPDRAETAVNAAAPERFAADSMQNQHNEVFSSVEQMPEFPGGMQAFYQFLAHQVRYPKAARDNNIQGRAIITFVIEKDGSLSDVKSLRDPGSGLGEEAVRAVSASPKWTPGLQNGNTIRTQYTVPVVFTLANDDKPDKVVTDTAQRKQRQLFTINRVVFKRDRASLDGADESLPHKNVFFKMAPNSPPLVVIDGKEATASFDLNSIDPSKIKSISVLKDQSAVAAYGSKVTGRGVIEVTTTLQQNKP